MLLARIPAPVPAVRRHLDDHRRHRRSARDRQDPPPSRLVRPGTAPIVRAVIRSIPHPRRAKQATSMCLAFIDSRRPDPGAFWPLGRVPAKGGSRLREWNREGVAGWDQAICRSIDREGGTEWRLPVHPLVELKLGWSVQGPDQRHRVDGFLPIGSPAVDVVPAAECISLTDRLGVTRPQQGRPSGSVACDIGSFERVLGDSPV